MLTRAGLPHSWHKVVPFVGDLVPGPEIRDPHDVILFGAYTLWRYAEAHALRPGVIRIRSSVHETPWQPSLLNGPHARFMALRDVPEQVADDGRAWFLRPVADSKAEPGRVRPAGDIRRLAKNVLAVDPEEIPRGALRPETDLMLAPPVEIFKEWRVWVVEDRVVTASLYKEGTRVVYRREMDDDARAFARELVAANPAYARAYVIDICRSEAGLRLLETNCLNAAGFYAADLARLVEALEDMARTWP